MSVYECECQAALASTPEKCWVCDGAVNPEKSIQSASPVPRDQDVELALLNSVLTPKTGSSDAHSDFLRRVAKVRGVYAALYERERRGARPFGREWREYYLLLVSENIDGLDRPTAPKDGLKLPRFDGREFTRRAIWAEPSIENLAIKIACSYAVENGSLEPPELVEKVSAYVYSLGPLKGHLRYSPDDLNNGKKINVERLSKAAVAYALENYNPELDESSREHARKLNKKSQAIRKTNAEDAEHAWNAWRDTDRGSLAATLSAETEAKLWSQLFPDFARGKNVINAWRQKRAEAQD